MKIKFVQNTRFDLVEKNGAERLVDYFGGTVVDDVNVEANGDYSTVTFSNGAKGLVYSDSFEVIQENSRNFEIPSFSDLTNEEEHV